MKKLLNGQLVDMTNEEIAQKEKDEQNAIADLQKEEQEKLDKEQANQSAIDKLKALGLTDEEIKAFRGN